MTKKKVMDWKIFCTGLVCITVLECFAMAMGFNGTLLKTVLVIIALAIGIKIPTPKVMETK